MFSSRGGFLTNAMYHPRVIIKLTHNDESKNMPQDSQILRAKEKHKLSHGGPSQRHALGTNLPIEALHQGRHLV